MKQTLTAPAPLQVSPHAQTLLFESREEALLHCPAGHYVEPLYGLGWAVLPLERI